MMDWTQQISNWAGGGATAALGAGQLLYGMYDQKRNKRPEYKIPDEAYQNLNQAQQEALQGMPAAVQQQYINNLNQSSAYALSQAGSRRAGLTGVAALNQNQNQALQGLAAQNAQVQMQNRQQLYGMRNQLADYKGQAFQFNQVNPYYERTAQNQALMGAGMQNISQGFQASNSGNVDWGGGQRNMPQQQQPQPQVNYQTPITYQMSPYQTGGIYQNTTPDPYSNQVALNTVGLQGSNIWQ